MVDAIHNLMDCTDFGKNLYAQNAPPLLASLPYTKPTQMGHFYRYIGSSP